MRIQTTLTTALPPQRLTLLLALLLTACRPAPDPLPQLPRTVLWAWERPEDLRFLNPRTTAIAFLAHTFTLTHGHLLAIPRRQPLRFVPGTPLIAVVRLESDATGLPAVSEAARAIPALTLPAIAALQIDFDARLSERAWYTALLTALPKSPPLLITALTSWCESDPWIRSLPIAAAVPMVFRMGAATPPPRTLNFPVALCRANLGLAADELPARIPAGPRLWLFTTRPWTPDSVSGILREARRRQ